MKKEMIDEDLVELTIENYQYVWKKTRGTEVSESLKGFHAHLHEELGYELYSRTLERTEFFSEADNSFFRLMGVQVREIYFKKDAEIIRCNDVQGMIYIVSRGSVDISVAQTRLCTLGCGGMFGSFKAKSETRQSISAIAKVHCNILVIDGVEFHRVLYRLKVLKILFVFFLILDSESVSRYTYKSKTSKLFKCRIYRTKRRFDYRL